MSDAQKFYKVILTNPRTGRQYEWYCHAGSEVEANQRAVVAQDEVTPIGELPDLWTCYAIEHPEPENKWGAQP